MSKKWVVKNKKADFSSIASKYQIDPVIARIMVNRGVIDFDKYLYGTVKDMHAPSLLKDMEKAVSIVKEKISENKSIRIIGDYDADGTTATAILYKGLLHLGAKVDFQIPHRVEDGYGLNLNIIKKAIADKIDTIITCDNGIAAKEQIAYAKEHGLTVIVTDHHEVPFIEMDGKKEYILPDADAIINPKQEDCTYPFKGICGAMVALKLIQELFGYLPDKEYLALAAIGTVCDVMELKDENRYLVKESLNYLQYNKGINKLIKENGLEDKQISAYHVGFIIGPCINASGRLDSATKAVQLMCSDDDEQIAKLAVELKADNEERKELTVKGVEEAISIIEEKNYNNDKVILLDINCHESIAGIIAGKIREKYNRPTIVVTPTENGYKGSARSIDNYDIFKELTKCKGLLTKFGGHPMAAGLSLSKENIETLRRMLNDNCTLTEDDFVEKKVIDVPMPLSYVTKEFVNQLNILEPFGAGNEKPVFAQKNIEFKSGEILGKNKNVGKYRLFDGKLSHTGMLFSNLDEFNEYVEKEYGVFTKEFLYMGESEIQMSIIYYPTLNEYRGMTSLQFVITDYQ